MGPEQEQKFVGNIINRVHETLSPSATIIRNDKIVSKKSDIIHSVDLSIRYDILNYTILIIVEWNKTDREITTDQISKLISKVYNIDANKVLLISSSGFSSDAVQKALEHSIELCTFEEITERDWSAGLYIPIAYDFRQPDLKIHFSGDIPDGFVFPDDGLDVHIPLEEGGEIILYNLFQLMWNGGNIPLEEGHYNYPIPVYKPITLSHQNKQCTIKGIYFLVEVISKKYFGYLDLNSCMKIAGVFDKETKTLKIEDLFVDVHKIKTEWEELTDLTEQLGFQTLVLEVREQVG